MGSAGNDVDEVDNKGTRTASEPATVRCEPAHEGAKIEAPALDVVDEWSAEEAGYGYGV